MTHPMLTLADWEDATPDPAIIITDGPSVKIYTHGGNRTPGQLTTGASLIIVDGPDGNRERTFHKTPRTMTRLIILGTRGSISLEAKRWLADAGVTWAHIETGGKRIRILDESRGFTDPQLARKQVLCTPGLPLEVTGVEINRHLITAKLDGQAFNAKNLLDNPGVADEIWAIRDSVMSLNLDTARLTIDAIRGLEGDGAKKYWEAMRGYPVTYTGNQPLHPTWLSYQGRKSELYSWETNRDATDPVNAALNYAYHIGENLATIGILAQGLSPVFGISHNDKNQDKYRDAFTLDVLEVLRPWIDEQVLELFRKPVRKDWFRMVKVTGNGKTRDGVIQVQAPFTHRIITAVNSLGSKLQPSLKHVTQLLQAVD